MKVSICDCCKTEHAINDVTMNVGRSRDAGGSMSDDFDSRDLCGGCALLILRRLTSGRRADVELNIRILEVIDAIASKGLAAGIDT